MINCNKNEAMLMIFCSQFGVAFLEAQGRSNARTKHSSFDTSVVEVNKEDLQSFLTKLQL